MSVPFPDPENSSQGLALSWANALQRRFSLLDDPQHPEALGSEAALALLRDLCDALESGHLRVTRRTADGRWSVNAWVKRALVVLSSKDSVESQPGPIAGSELSSLGWIRERPTNRRVPAGSFLRRGSYLAPGCVVMPPSTVQAGAAVEVGAMIDSHVLVGSGVWVGEGVAVGCGTMLGGSLLPETALSVVLEEEVLVGGNCGLYGPIVVGKGSAIFSGSVLRSAEGCYDSRQQAWLEPDAAGTLYIPPGSSITMGLPPADFAPDKIRKLAAILE